MVLTSNASTGVLDTRYRSSSAEVRADTAALSASSDSAGRSGRLRRKLPASSSSAVPKAGADIRLEWCRLITSRPCSTDWELARCMAAPASDSGALSLSMAGAMSGPLRTSSCVGACAVFHSVMKYVCLPLSSEYVEHWPRISCTPQSGFSLLNTALYSSEDRTVCGVGSSWRPPWYTSHVCRFSSMPLGLENSPLPAESTCPSRGKGSDARRSPSRRTASALTFPARARASYAQPRGHVRPASPAVPAPSGIGSLDSSTAVLASTDASMVSLKPQTFSYWVL